MRKSTFLIPVIVIVAVAIWSSLFVVDEREKALVLQFGQIKQVREEPGLGFKLPIIQEVVKYDDRILSLDTATIEVTPADDRRLVVDAFARYRISDVVQFRQAVGVGGLRAAEDRLQSIMNAQIREVLGADQVTSDRILSAERGELARRIRDSARESAQGLGLDVVDVRLKQTNLPQQNLEATFARMRAEREREAADEIARGNEAAQRVRAIADRTVVETLSDAERDAQITRGEADAERNRIYAEAYGDSPDFFSFYRSLSALEQSLQAESSTLVLAPDSPFIQPLFDAIRADGLDRAEAGLMSPDDLRDRAPERTPSEELPDEVRERLEEDVEAETETEDGAGG
ncbi:protease modulator HflC [Rhodosalinus sp.]|uniref:protease modulator HflC n=2 Tax=Rhodosalinus sp. TaxID=2047741 RepID=UPI00397A01C5